MTADAKTKKLRSVRVAEYDVIAASGEKASLPNSIKKRLNRVVEANPVA